MTTVEIPRVRKRGRHRAPRVPALRRWWQWFSEAIEEFVA